MLGMVLNNRFCLMTLILYWKLLAIQPFREKTASLILTVRHTKKMIIFRVYFNF